MNVNGRVDGHWCCPVLAVPSCRWTYVGSFPLAYQTDKNGVIIIKISNKNNKF